MKKTSAVENMFEQENAVVDLEQESAAVEKTSAAEKTCEHENAADESVSEGRTMPVVWSSAPD